MHFTLQISVQRNATGCKFTVKTNTSQAYYTVKPGSVHLDQNLGQNLDHFDPEVGAFESLWQKWHYKV